MRGCRAQNSLACRTGFCAGLVKLSGMKRDFGVPAATCFAGARHVCPARFVCAGLSAAACIVNLVAGGAAVGGGKQGD